MRPAVYASVVRNRKHSSRRVAGLKHEFSKRQMILMLLIGSLLVIFGLIVTIIGLVTAVHGDRVFYKVIGPAGLACGIGLVAAGGIYYCCWGYRPGNRLRQTSNYKNRNDSKSDESRPDDALGGSSDVKLEMTEGV